MVSISIILLSFITAGPIDYKSEFGSDYTRAVQWIKFNEPAFSFYSNKFGIPAAELKSIVFPELIRYNSVFDAIEINTLKFLYVSEGKNYADFSIEHFQMKPSFAENIEEDANKILTIDFLQASGLDKLKEITDNEAARRERIARLTSTHQQLVYLCAFYKICELKFAGITFRNTGEKLKFFATCYNGGYRRNYEDLLSLQSKKHFHTGKFFTSSKYNYADISAYYFENEK